MSPAVPPDPVAVVREERALREQRRWAEAEVMLAAAIAAWPNDETLLVDFGLLAHQQMHWAEMAARFAVVRERFPGQVLGASRLGEARRWLGQFDAADATISEDVLRFPDIPELLVQWVLVACDRAERGATGWNAAEKRGEAFVARLPDEPLAYRYRAEPYVLRRQWSQAEVAVAEGLHRLGPVPPLVLFFAELAARREDWAAAARRWEAALRHLPEAEQAYLGRAQALRELSHFDDLETLAEAGRLRLPGSLAIAREQAWAASLRRDWPAALTRWRALMAETPGDPGVRERVVEAELHAREALTASSTPLAAALPTLPPTTIPTDLKQLLLNFEPLGEDCEFGLVQRHAGLEPLGLFRFAGITLDNLVAALDSDLAGIGSSEFTHVFLRDGVEYMVNDTRYGLGMHTFVGPEQVTAQQFAEGACRRLRFLAGKLMEDLREPAKLFVRTSRACEPLERILRLHRALTRHGPATLLFVQETAIPARIDRAERLTPGVIQGWIERFSIRDPLDDQWHELCRNAYSLWQSGAPAERQEPPEPQPPTTAALLQPITVTPALIYGMMPAPQASVALAASASPDLPRTVPQDTRRLLLGFEPLGHDGKFSLVQRHFGLEPLSLLRFATIPLDGLIAALDSDLAGIGDPKFTRLRLDPGNQYVVDDARYAMEIHTHIGSDIIGAGALLPVVQRRMAFLARNMLENLREPVRIFLRTCDPPEPPERLMALLRALCRHGRGTLLAVERSSSAARNGRAEWLAPGVMRGWVEQLGTQEPPGNQWIELCRSAYALWAGGPLPAGQQPQMQTDATALLQPFAAPPAVTFAAATSGQTGAARPVERSVV